MTDRLARYLTKQELITLLGVVNQLLTVTKGPEIQDVLLQLGRLVPFDRAIAALGRTARHGGLDGSTMAVHQGFPEDWLVQYFEKGCAAVDPLLRDTADRPEPRVWTSRDVRRALTPCPLSMRGHLSALGISTKITIGVASRHRRVRSFMCFSGSFGHDQTRHATIVEHIAPSLHVALMRVVFPPPTDTLPVLSPREHEVLQWIKEGKTNWVIGRILRISERTVCFHVERILQKLDASNRSHAVAIAADRGLIGH